jgi:hypothetical protein
VKGGRCKSCRWWERSNNFRAADRDWGLCHFWGGRFGRRILGGFIDGSFGHEPRGADKCEWHNAPPDAKDGAQLDGSMPTMKCEGEVQP